MKKTIYNCLCLIACMCLLQATVAQIKPVIRTKVQPPANKSKFWLFLLAGQSNMAGRANIEGADTIPNAHVLTLNKNGEWEIAKDPIHFDRAYAAVGPGLTFGREMAQTKDAGIYIGLIPCAVGGSGIDSWKPGSGKNYQAAIERCQKAMASGTLKGIIWHQGETDCTEKGFPGYSDKMMSLIAGFRKDLGNAYLPFVAGELPAFQKQQPDSTKQLREHPYVDQINSEINSLKGKVKNYDVVSAANTDHRGDHLHFNTVSARLMGKRYAILMKKLLKVD